MKSRVFFLLASGSEAGLPLIRNVVLAWCLSPGDVGTAILIATTWSLVEVCLDLGLAQFTLSREAPASDPAVLATLHALQLARACLVGVLIVLAAPVLARAMQAPALEISLIVVGVAAALRGFMSLRPYILARGGNFFPASWVLLSGQVAWTVVTIITLQFVATPTAMAIGIAGGMIVSTAITHWTASGSWQLGWCRRTVREAMQFGLPLVPNGMASATIFMGDRLLIASMLGVSAVAKYAILLTAAFVPKGVLLRYLSSVSLPLFSDRTLSADNRSALMRAWLLLMTGFAFGYATAVVLVVMPLVPLVFGPNYTAEPQLAALLGVAAFSRCVHAIGVPVMMAKGRTIYAFFINAGLAISLGLGAAGAAIGGDLASFMAGLFAGEALVAAAVVRDLPRALDLPLAAVLRTLALPFAAVCSIAGLSLHWSGAEFWLMAVSISTAVMLDLGLQVLPLAKRRGGFLARLRETGPAP